MLITGKPQNEKIDGFEIHPINFIKLHYTTTSF
jgi:hypothetical protein